MAIEVDPDDVGVVYPFKYARVNATADGVNTLVAAVAGKKLRVLSYMLSNSALGGIHTIQDDAGTPVVHAQLALALNGVAVYTGGPEAPAFEIASGKALTVSNATGVDLLGHLTYIEV